MRRAILRIARVALRGLQASKLVSILIVAITAKGAVDLLNGFVNGSVSNILFVPINPPLTMVNGANVVIFVYLMVFGWFFTNALLRITTAYIGYADNFLWAPVRDRIFRPKDPA